MSTHTSTQRDRVRAMPADCDSLLRFAETLKLRTLAASTQAEYRRYLRKLAGRAGRDPAALDEAQVRAHLLHLKDAQHYSPSSMRTAVAAMRAFYGLHLGREWKLFDLVRSPSAQTLPAVLTRGEVARLFAVIREHRFRMVLRLIYACGLRVGEAVTLEVGDIQRDGPRLHLRRTKGQKERLVPLPAVVLSRVAGLLAHAPASALDLPRRRPRLARSGLDAATRRRRRADGDRFDPALRAAGPRRGAAAGRDARAHAAAFVCDASAGRGRVDPADLGVSGTRSLETTLVYTHLTAVNEAGARAALERMRPAVA